MSKEQPDCLIDIAGLALDVDGVLTDGSVWWSSGGEEWKRFGFADIMGLSLARRSGLKVALISGENSPLVDHFARKLHIEFAVKGCRDKAAALDDFAKQTGIALRAICYMGDDVNDLAAMRLAGCSAAPANASLRVREIVKIVTGRTGGDGAVRELVERILAAQGLEIEEVLARPLPTLSCDPTFEDQRS
jgi:3-deoxy-D-manno-octulosonate 8-phosphate phosphatase (KDO 8-P phosphatase)